MKRKTINPKLEAFFIPRCTECNGERFEIECPGDVELQDEARTNFHRIVIEQPHQHLRCPACNQEAVLTAPVVFG